MDEFGVLVRQLGIKPQGKSAPMSASKEPFKTHNSDTTPNLYAGFDSTPLPNPSNSTGNSHSVSSKSLLDDQSNLFLSKSDRGPWSYGGSGGYDDVFQSSLKNPDFADSTSGADSGLGFNLESRFDGSMNLKLKSSFSTAKGGATIGDDIDDTFSGFLSTPSDPTNKVNDLLSSVDPVDDFFGNLGKMWPGSMASGGNSLDETNKNELEGDDLIPGFGRMTAMNNRERAQASSAAEDLGVSSIDELENFAMGRIWKNANGHLDVEAKVGNTATGASSTVEEALYGVDSKMTKTTKHRPWETDFILIDENSDNGSVREPKEIKAGKKTFEVESPENGIQPAPQANQRHGEVDLDSFFSVHGENNTASMPDKTNRSSIKSEVVPDLFSGTSSSTETDFSGKSITDDLFSSFGAGPPSREAEEFEEENEGRRRARFGRYQRTQARVAQALTDMNEREWQAQQEQEERRRIADTMDAEMKRWAAGKEGNLRALLSSLQQVLWPECEWRPFSLTDLITPSQVKIAYMKAALCVHPDKVQQKGASLHQKYVAEKVFDLLKEAWKKFKSEELR